jgi:hypothetical protein
MYHIIYIIYLTKFSKKNFVTAQLATFRFFFFFHLVHHCSSSVLQIKHAHGKEATTPARPHKQPHVLQRIRAIRNYCPKKTKKKIKKKTCTWGRSQCSSKQLEIIAVRSFETTP